MRMQTKLTAKQTSKIAWAAGTAHTVLTVQDLSAVLTASVISEASIRLESKKNFAETEQTYLFTMELSIQVVCSNAMEAMRDTAATVLSVTECADRVATGFLL